MRSTARRLNPGVAARGAALALAAVAALGLAGCGTASSPSGGGTASVADTAAAPLTLSDGWVKAVVSIGMPASPTASPSASSTGGMSMAEPMTAMFGTLKNDTDATITVTGGSCAIAQRVELHETVINASGVSQMQQKQGGFVIPAGGTFVLKPGGNHVMLIGLTEPLKNGSTVTVDLETSAGPVPFTVPVRTFTGANETYNASPSS